MNPTNNGGPAFPVTGYTDGNGDVFSYPEFGMSLRDWFAGQALAGVLASNPDGCEPKRLAHEAYLYADAMLAARDRKPCSDAEIEGGAG